MSRHGCQDDFLICIVGFPRSGTTLTEQILSSHPDVIGLGERTDFHRAAGGLQTRLKSRQEYPLCCPALTPSHVRGMARSIRVAVVRKRGAAHSGCHQSAREIAGTSDSSRSCFQEPASFTAAGNQLTTASRATCSALPQFCFRRTSPRWRRSIGFIGRSWITGSRCLPPGSIFECPYEAMVADPEPLVLGLHEHCGISFNEDWARFHDHARRVDTASLWQVRRPIYQTSVQRWKNYARFLGPLLELDEGSAVSGPQ